MRQAQQLLVATVFAGGLVACQPNRAACPPGAVWDHGGCQPLCDATKECPTGAVCLPAGVCLHSPRIHGLGATGSEITITGEYLDDAEVTLRSQRGESFVLAAVAAAPTRLVVTVPSGVTEQRYTLVVANQAGTDQDEVTLLRGADGNDLTALEVITRIDAARAGGTTLTADTVGAYSDVDITDMLSRLGAAETTVAGLATGIASTSDHAKWVCPGLLWRGVCVVDYNNSGPGAVWGDVVNICTSRDADLCTTAQYAVLREGEGWNVDNSTIFYENYAVWSADFSDNDSSVKNRYLGSSCADTPLITNNYGHACCYNYLAEPYRSRVTVYEATGSTTGNGVWVTYVHAITDTVFPAAANHCASFSSDLCTKSQYVVLNDNSLFGGGPMQLWSNDMSDNDNDAFDLVIGDHGSSPGAHGYYAYACCASQRFLDGSCPGVQERGVCMLDSHTGQDATFLDAARACISLGGDICSKSQMTVLRNAGEYGAQASWTNDGGDNDSLQSGGLTSSQPDDPDPATDLMGYACCL